MLSMGKNNAFPPEMALGRFLTFDQIHFNSFSTWKTANFLGLAIRSR